MLTNCCVLHQTKGKYHQGGNVLVLFVISLFALITLASLALDGGHLLLNKGRLQNLVDAAALHAAKELDLGKTRAEAEIAAKELLQINLAHTDQQELSRAIDLAEADDTSTAVLSFEYSIDADPFNHIPDVSTDARFVKVSLTQLSLDSFLANVFSFNKQVSATALAGPSTAIVNCFTNLVPLMVCGTSDEPPYGLEYNTLHVMKASVNEDSALGAGNFQLVRLDGPGNNIVRYGLAGESNNSRSCFARGDGNMSIPTQPGGGVGPVSQGLNTRLGRWQGGVDRIDHPRDENICQGKKLAIEEDGSILVAEQNKAYRASQYQNDNANKRNACSMPVSNELYNNPTESDFSRGRPSLYDRRVMNVVIGRCDGKLNGTNDIDFLGVGCFFLTQMVEHKAQGNYIVGEFLNDCAGGGDASLDPVDSPGPYKMVLYHVPNSTDS